MCEVELIGGGERKHDGPVYFNQNYESMRGYKVTGDGKPVRCVEADVRCNLIRVLDPKGKIMWMLDGVLVQTTILRGYVEITE